MGALFLNGLQILKKKKIGVGSFIYTAVLIPTFLSYLVLIPSNFRCWNLGSIYFYLFIDKYWLSKPYVLILGRIPQVLFFSFPPNMSPPLRVYCRASNLVSAKTTIRIPSKTIEATTRSKVAPPPPWIHPFTIHKNWEPTKPLAAVSNTT